MDTDVLYVLGPDNYREPKVCGIKSTVVIHRECITITTSTSPSLKTRISAEEGVRVALQQQVRTRSIIGQKQTHAHTGIVS